MSVSCPSVFLVGSGLPLEPVLGSGSGCAVSQSVNCGLAGDGDVCDRKPREFAIAIFGALATSLYNKSCDSCAMPHKNRHQIVLRYCYKYRAAGLLSQNHSCNDYMTAPYFLGTHHFGHRNLKILHDRNCVRSCFGALQFLQAILNVFFCNDVGDLALWES